MPLPGRQPRRGGAWWPFAGRRPGLFSGALDPAAATPARRERGFLSPSLPLSLSLSLSLSLFPSLSLSSASAARLRLSLSNMFGCIASLPRQPIVGCSDWSPLSL